MAIFTRQRCDTLPSMRPASKAIIFRSEIDFISHCILMSRDLGDIVDLVDIYIESDYQIEDDGTGVIRRIRAFMAAYYLAVLLNPNLNYPVWSDENGWEFVATVDELLAKFAAGAYDNPMPLSLINQIALRSPALIVWLSADYPQLAEKIKGLHDKCTDAPDSIYYNSDSAYRIAYELNRDADFPLKREMDAEYRKSDKTISGYYYDRNGVMHQIRFLPTPLTTGKHEDKN